MSRLFLRAIVPALVVVAGVAGCGEGSKVAAPKADPNAPKVEQKIPGGAGKQPTSKTRPD